MLGLHWMLVIAQVSGVLRVLAYSVLPPQGNWFYLSFAIELLKGTSTGCLISSAVRMANDIAPPNCANTAQSYIAGIYSGLSLAMGGAFGGLIIYLLPNNSVAGMFYVTFWLGLATLIICLFKYSIIDRAILVPNSWKKQSKNFS
jgi:MFS family permease